MLENIFKIYYMDKLELLFCVVKSNFFESILLSMVAALIFHYIFVTIPLNKRKNKLRPIIETDMNLVYAQLNFTFDLIFRHTENGPSYYQDKMRGGQLTKKDFHIALQNKIPSRRYLNDKEISSHLIIIGDKLKNYLTKTNILLQHIISLYDYCSDDEILLLGKIRQQIEKMQLDISPMDFETDNFYQLYLLYIELITTIIYTHKLPNKSNFQNKIICFYFSKNYKQCKKTIQDYKKNYPNTDGVFLDLYLAKCELNLKNNRKFEKLISNVMKQKPELIGHRRIYDEIFDIKIVKNLFEKYYTDEEIKRLKDTLEIEQIQKENFENQNKNLYKYFHNKEYSFDK
ncbi:MAG: hypothetical protein Q7S59_00165 [Sulfurimonas sp.]|nr:hypothetical protein [Sulfurimonas sp.]